MSETRTATVVQFYGFIIKHAQFLDLVPGLVWTSRPLWLWKWTAPRRRFSKAVFMSQLGEGGVGELVNGWMMGDFLLKLQTL